MPGFKVANVVTCPLYRVNFVGLPHPTGMQKTEAFRACEGVKASRIRDYFLTGRNDMAKAPWVDEDKCTGCGLCVTNIPGVFRLTDIGKAECYDATAATEKEIQEAAIDI